MKTLNIEDLLNWAFVHELPKGGGVEGLGNANSAWGLMVELGTRVSSGVFGGGDNYFIEQGDPNTDALVVGQAVRSLAHAQVSIPDDWHPLADWPVPVEAGDIAREAAKRCADHYFTRSAEARGRGIVAMVAGAAVLGRPPQWSSDAPKVKMAMRGGKPAWFVREERRDWNGKRMIVELDGYNVRRGRPVKNAYRKYEFSDDPMGEVLARLDYQIWVAALRHVERDVSAHLTAHRLSPFRRAMTPWLDIDAGGIVLHGDSSGSEKKRPHAA